MYVSSFSVTGHFNTCSVDVFEEGTKACETFSCISDKSSGISLKGIMVVTSCRTSMVLPVLSSIILTRVWPSACGTSMKVRLPSDDFVGISVVRSD